MVLINFNKVSKIYKDGNENIYALNNISFDIKEGAFVAIMGPSGSGKSTLLSLLGGLNTPTKGDVSIDNITLYDLSLEKQADFRSEYIGFVFQSYQLISYLTALENVMLPLAITKIKNKEQKKEALTALESVGLTNKTNRLPDQLSGGEQQRVSVARAIVNNPPILLADEPTGNLDSETGIETIKLLRVLNKKGQTIIMVTHDKNIAQYADYIIKIKDGQIDNS